MPCVKFDKQFSPEGPPQEGGTELKTDTTNTRVSEMPGENVHKFKQPRGHISALQIKTIN